MDCLPANCAGPLRPHPEEVERLRASQATVVTIIDSQDQAPNAESTPKGKEIARLLDQLLERKERLVWYTARVEALTGNTEPLTKAFLNEAEYDKDCNEKAISRIKNDIIARSCRPE